jgi:hypothetical protein
MPKEIEGAAGEYTVPLVGRRAELDALANAIRLRQSRLVAGPPGIGKTRILVEALSLGHGPHLLLRAPGTLHALLARLAAMLHCRAARATSSALKAGVLAALEAEPRPILLEDATDCDPRMYRFLRAVYHTPGSCLIATARSRAATGHLRKLLWDPREEICLKPLSRPEAGALFEAAAAAYNLSALDLEDFRNRTLTAARGNPGQILATCRLATRPEYRRGRRIKSLPLRMDALPSFLGDR